MSDDGDDAGIEDVVLRGAWHYLCVGVFVQAVQRIAEATNLWSLKKNAAVKSSIDKEAVYQREAARRWIEGGVGLVTFEDCCEAMEVEPARAREKIREYCNKRKRARLPTEGRQ